jgi:hypothetical protein
MAQRKELGEYWVYKKEVYLHYEMKDIQGYISSLHLNALSEEIFF